MRFPCKSFTPSVSNLQGGTEGGRDGGREGGREGRKGGRVERK